MNNRFLDPYSHTDSPIRRLPASVKLGAAFAGVLLLVLVPVTQLAYMAAYALALALVAAASRIPPAFLIRRTLLLEPFVLGVALLAWFQPNGRQIFLGVLIKSTLCLTTTILLANTTPFGDMLRVMRRLRIPPLLVTTLALMNRYIYVLADEAARMQRARSARTFSTQSASLWKSMASVIGILFVRASERAERIHAAMCARGWK
jgi:cobalt/nickel transport system permease protein